MKTEAEKSGNERKIVRGAGKTETCAGNGSGGFAGRAGACARASWWSNDKGKRNWVWLLIAIFFCKELFWAYLIPPWKAPDELAHLGYVQYLAEKGDFPVLGKTTFTEVDFDAGGIYRAEDTGAPEGNLAAATYPDGMDQPQSADKSVRAHTIKSESENIASEVAIAGADDQTTPQANLPHAPYINWIAQHPPLYYAMLVPVYSVFEGMWAGAVDSRSPGDTESSGSLWLVFILRVFSILLGCTALYYAYKALRILSEADRAAAEADRAAAEAAPGAGTGAGTKTYSHVSEMFILAVIAGMAFLPGFSHISALMNNDNLVNALAAILFYLVVKDFFDGKNGQEHGWAAAIKIGVVLGSLALTKITALPLWGAVFIIVLVKYFRATASIAAKHERKKLLKNFTRYLLKIFGIALLVSGWWYVRNIFLYGMLFPDLEGIVAKNQSLLLAWPDLSQRFPEIINFGAAASPSLGKFIFGSNFLFEYFKNFWGVFGIPMRNLNAWQYWVLGGISLASALGYVRKFWQFFRQPTERGPAAERGSPAERAGKKAAKNAIRTDALLRRILAWPALIFWIPVLAVFGALFVKLFQIYLGRGFLGAMHGRYVYSVLMPIIYLLLTGIVYLFGREDGSVAGGRRDSALGHGGKSRRWLLCGLAGITIFFVLNDFYTLAAIIIPEFY